jgi:hypothetical protein
MNDMSLVGFNFSGSAAVTGSLVTYEVSNDGSTFHPLYNYSGTEIQTTVSGSSRAYALDPTYFHAWGFVKIKLGTSASPVNQATNALTVEAYKKKFS